MVSALMVPQTCLGIGVELLPRSHLMNLEPCSPIAMDTPLTWQCVTLSKVLN